jgi:UDP-glucose 4-epimerase
MLKDEEAVMVTGGTGFIGSHLVKRLVDEQMNVVVFDVSSDFRRLDGVLDKIQFVQGDLSIFSEVADAVKTHQVKYIYHTGGLLVGACNIVPLRAVKVNAEGTANILEASRIMDVEKVIFTSTVAVFASSPERSRNECLTDDYPKYPRSPYGATKLLGELYGLYYNRTHGLDFRGVRFFFVYGPTDPYKYHERSSIITNPALGKSIRLAHNSESIGSWIYVKDAVNALTQLFNATTCKTRIYNIKEADYSFQHVADTVKTFIPNAEITFTAETPKTRRTIDDSNARLEIGWKPKYTLEEGIKETIQETRQRAVEYDGVFIKNRYI